MNFRVTETKEPLMKRLEGPVEGLRARLWPSVDICALRATYRRWVEAMSGKSHRETARSEPEPKVLALNTRKIVSPWESRFPSPLAPCPLKAEFWALERLPNTVQNCGSSHNFSKRNTFLQELVSVCSSQ